MTERKKFSLKYGSEISLVYEDDGGYLTCPGGAHPQLRIRSVKELTDVLSFENCVFVLHPPIDPSTQQRHQQQHGGNAGSHGGGGGSGGPHNEGGGSGSGGGGVGSHRSTQTKKVVLQTEVTYGARFLLKHKQSGLFVSILTTQPSELDSDCHMVSLITENEAAQTRSALFRFTPRFKVHNEGDYVCQGDQLLLQTFSHKLFLHVTMLAAPVVSASLHNSAAPTHNQSSSRLQMPLLRATSSVAGNSNDMFAALEVNGSETMSAWIVKQYDSGMDHPDCAKLFAKGKPPVVFGNPVALFHRERESLLTSSIARSTTGAQRSPSATPKTSIVSVASPVHNTVYRSSAASLETRRRGPANQSMYISSPSGSLRNNTADSGIQASPVTADVAQQGSGGAQSQHFPAPNKAVATGVTAGGATDRSNTVFPLLTPFSTGYLSNEFSFGSLRCSCAAYWVFEQATPTTGGPLRFGTHFRLRQAATNMYLAVLGNGMDGLLNSKFPQTPFFSPSNDSPQLFGGSIRQSPFNSSVNNTSFQGRDFASSSTTASAANNGSGFTLGLIPAPSTEDMQQRSLFVVEHTFYPEARVVTETDFFRIQNVDTGLWLCTDGDNSNRGSDVMLHLELRPHAHDAWMTGHISEQAHRDVLHIFYNYDALQRYKNIFASWWRQKSTSKMVELELPASRKQTAPNNFASGEASEASKDALAEESTSTGVKATKSPPQSPQEGGPNVFSTKSHQATIRRCADALASLIEFCSASDDPDPFSREGLPLVDHQRMMFDLQLHRMVFDIIVAPLVPVTDAPRDTTIIDLSHRTHRLPKLPLQGGAVHRKLFDVKHAEYGPLHNISRLGFRLIKQMVMGNPSFAALLANYIPLMFELDGMKLHVVDVMHEIFTENAELPAETITAAVDHYVKTLVTKQRSAGYLKFLATMCAQRNNLCGLVENQELVCKKLIHDVPADQAVLLRTVLLESGHVGVVWSSSEPPYVIEKFLTSHKDAKLIKFFEGQIELFAKLSCGCGSTMCSKTLERLFPSLQLNSVINTILWTGEEVAGKPSKLDLTRCNILRLAVNLYVHPEFRHNETQLALNTILIGSSQLRNKWNARRTDPTFPHSAKKDTVIMASLKHAAKQLMRANPFIVISDRPRNELLRTVVDLWCDFVTYRQYSTEELQELLPMVVRLLDGTQDIANLAKLSSMRSGNDLKNHFAAAAAMALGQGGKDVVGGSATSGTFTRSQSNVRSAHSAYRLQQQSGPNVNNNATTSNASHVNSSSRFQKTEETNLVMELRLSICRLLSLILRNMIHDAGDEIVVDIFHGLGGLRSCGQGPSSSFPSEDTTNELIADGSEAVEAVDSNSDLRPLRKKHTASPLQRLWNLVGSFRSSFGGSNSSLKAGSDGTSHSSNQSHEDDVVESVAITHINALEVIDALVQRKVDVITVAFQPETLVPIILDTAQYNHYQLTTEAMNVLVDLCSVRRKLCETVLSVKLMPSREMLSQFDRLHLVAVELESAVESGSLDEMTDAMEMLLKTMLQNFVPKNRLRSSSSNLSSSSSWIRGRTDSSSTMASSPGPAGSSDAMSESRTSSMSMSESGSPDLRVVPVVGEVASQAGSGGRPRSKSVKFTDGSDEDEPSPLPQAAQRKSTTQRTAKVRWAEATTVAKLVAMSKRVQRKRNSLGLDPSSDVPLDVICRAELMCHWGIHQTLLRQLESGKIGPNHPAYIEFMDFFYYFTLSPSNARQLAPSLPYFIEAIKTSEEVRIQCMHVVVAVLSAKAMRGNVAKTSGPEEMGSEANHLDVGVISSLADMIAQEQNNRDPDSSFLRLVNKHLLGDAHKTISATGSVAPPTVGLSQTSSKQLVNMLHARNVFQYLSAPRTRASELQFNSSLVDMLCGMCRANRSVRSLSQRIVPQMQLIAVLSRKQRSEMVPRVHQAPYFRMLAEVYFSRDEESEAEKFRIMTLWNECSPWWGLMKNLGRQYGDVAVLQRAAVAETAREAAMRGGGTSEPTQPSEDELEASASRDFYFAAVPAAVTVFLSTTFSPRCTGTHRGEALEAIRDLANGIAAFASELVVTTGLFQALTITEILSLSRCISSIEDTLDALDDGYSIIDRLRLLRRYQLQDLIDELRTVSPTSSSLSELRRMDSTAKPSQYGAGSFFFQTNVRDMSEAEAAARRALAKFAPKDVVLSKALLKSSKTAHCFVRLLTNMATSDSPHNQLLQNLKRRQSGDDLLGDGSGPTGSSVDASVQVPHTLSKKSMESFVLKLLDHMMELALPADTISGLLNLIHAALVGMELPNTTSSDDGNDIDSSSAGGDPSSSAAAATSGVLAADLQQRQLIARQVLFERLGLMRVVTGLSDLSDHTVTKSALEAGIALLEGGNTLVQNNMLHYFETHDESFFHNVRDILQSSMERVQMYNDWVVHRLMESSAAGAMHAGGGSGTLDLSIGGASNSTQRAGDPPLTPRGAPTLANLRQKSLRNLISSGTPAAPGSPPLSGTNFGVVRYPGGSPFLFIGEIFRFLQLMCEGHHDGMQNYIRVQSDNLHSINILQEVLSLIVELTAVRIDNFNATVVQKGLELLTEFCQGPCVENQATLLQNDVCSLVAMIFMMEPIGAQGSGVMKSMSSGGSPNNSSSTFDLSMSFASSSRAPAFDTEPTIDRKALTELQHAASVTLLALTEGCSRPEVFQKVLSQIPLTLVERLVQSIVVLPNSGPSPAHTPRGVSPAGGSPRSHSPDTSDDDQEGGTKLATKSATDDEALEKDSNDGGSSSDDDEDDTDEVDTEEDLLFNLLIFTKSVTPFLERSNDHASLACSKSVFQLVPAISRRLGCIQVERDAVVERVYFPIPEICLSLTQKSKDDVLWSVDRSSRLTKLNDFFQKIDELMFEMNSVHSFGRIVDSWKTLALKTTAGHSHVALSTTTGRYGNETMLQLDSAVSTSAKTANRIRLLPLTDKWRLLWNKSLGPILCNSDPEYYERAALVLAVAINVFFVFTDGIDQEENTTTLIEWTVSILCAIQLGLYVVILVLDSLVFLPGYFYRAYRRRLRAAGIVVSTQQISQDDVMKATPSLRKRVTFALHRFTTTYYLAMTVASLLALFVHPYFAAIHLFGLINKSPNLRTVIVAITQNGKSLLLTMGLGVIIVYMFSIVGFTYFPEAFDGDEGASVAVMGDGGEGNETTSVGVGLAENCKTLSRCFTFILTSGLRQGGGVGDLMAKTPWNSHMLAHRMGYDFIFYALVNVVFLNILFGIIIDTFAELRDDKRRKEEDMATCCFICGLEAEVFEKEGGGFKRHVHREHNMWQYLYFIYHLRIKDPNDFNGQESYVYREMMRGSLGFVPDGKCLSLVHSMDQDMLASNGGAARSNGGKDDGDGGHDAAAVDAIAALRGGGADPVAATTFAIAGSVANAMKGDLDTLRDHLSTAILNVTTEMNQLAATVGAGAANTPGSLLSNPSNVDFFSTAPSLSIGLSADSFASGGLHRPPVASSVVRRRSKSIADGALLPSSSQLYEQQQQQQQRYTTEEGDEVRDLRMRLTKLAAELKSEQDRASALQVQLFSAHSATTAANEERDELAMELQKALARTTASTCHSATDLPSFLSSSTEPPASSAAPLRTPESPGIAARRFSQDEAKALVHDLNRSLDILIAAGQQQGGQLSSSSAHTSPAVSPHHEDTAGVFTTFDQKQRTMPPSAAIPSSSTASPAPLAFDTTSSPLLKLDGVPMDMSVHVHEGLLSHRHMARQSPQPHHSVTVDESMLEGPSPASVLAVGDNERHPGSELSSMTGLSRAASMLMRQPGGAANSLHGGQQSSNQSLSSQQAFGAFSFPPSDAAPSSGDAMDMHSPSTLDGLQQSHSAAKFSTPARVTLVDAGNQTDPMDVAPTIVAPDVVVPATLSQSTQTTVTVTQPQIEVPPATRSSVNASTQIDDAEKRDLQTNYILLKADYRSLETKSNMYYHDCHVYARGVKQLHERTVAAVERQEFLEAELERAESEKIEFARDRMVALIHYLKAEGELSEDVVVTDGGRSMAPAALHGYRGQQHFQTPY